jgi:SAM-dependent methyltransferase
MIKFNAFNVMKTDESTELLNSARCGIKMGNNDLAHLSNMTAINNYARIADEIKEFMANGSILDWGCGYGHMTYLLKKRLFNVTGYEVEMRSNINEIAIFNTLDIKYGKHGSELPFDDGSFDAALSCGTLEHVPDPGASLKEIHRVLKKGGKFFIYMLPNKFSYAEYLSGLRGISVHPVKYTVSTIEGLLKENGFEIVKIKKGNLLPKNLTGFPGFLKNIYGRFNKILVPLDTFLSHIPIIKIFCGVFEIIAKKS